ncbi:hypothetical protein [Vallicoccus soli]|uniref:hypothetical protein n=1 Tax=Vallicoccus soli TaxID=2339232 RepID=UPI001059C098|nr:hypothetical protein [Vallicoccus soli]
MLPSGGVVFRKALGWLLAAFVVYFLVTAPNESAELVRDVGTTLRDAAEAILTFFDELTPD